MNHVHPTLPALSSAVAPHFLRTPTRRLLAGLLLATLLLALSACSRAPKNGVADRHGKTLVAEFTLPPSTIAKLQAVRGNLQQPGEHLALSQSVDWRSPAFAVRHDANPHIVVVHVAGTATHPRKPALARWVLGWQMADGGFKTGMPLMHESAGAGAGETLRLSAASGGSRFEHSRDTALMIGLVESSNLVIEGVQVQVWSGLPATPWWEVLLSLQGLLTGLVALALGAWWMRGRWRGDSLAMPSRPMPTGDGQSRADLRRRGLDSTPSRLSTRPAAVGQGSPGALESVSTCPKCNYTRRPTDRTPAYECPSCGIVYAKFLALQRDAESKAQRHSRSGPASRPADSSFPITHPGLPRPRPRPAAPLLARASLVLGFAVLGETVLGLTRSLRLVGVMQPLADALAALYLGREAALGVLVLLPLAWALVRGTGLAWRIEARSAWMPLLMMSLLAYGLGTTALLGLAVVSVQGFTTWHHPLYPALTTLGCAGVALATVQLLLGLAPARRAAP